MARGEYAGDAEKRHKSGDVSALSRGSDSRFGVSESQLRIPTPVEHAPVRHSPVKHLPANHATSHSVSKNIAAGQRVCSSIAHIYNYGITNTQLQSATRRAEFSGRPAGEELIRAGAISRMDFARIAADFHKLQFSNCGPDPDLLTGHAAKIRAQASRATIKPGQPQYFGIVTQYRGWQERPRIFVACEPAAASIIEKMARHPLILKTQIVLTTRKILNYCQFLADTPHHLKNAISGLAKYQPEQSASRVITLQQLSVFMLFIAIVAGSLWLWPVISLLVLHLIASLFYMCVTLMRAAMIVPGADLELEPQLPIATHVKHDHKLPTYTIMVALHHEAGQIDRLVRSLKLINWPKDRLQILLVCEADDLQTIAQCRLHDEDERIQTVICPVSKPRTKPKALNFALPLATGEYLVLYDAEDRPHCNQLREAYCKFQIQPGTACLQSPLIIHNDEQSWLTRMFAIEYVTQFKLILPVLEKWGSPIPLGGTSNHFRTNILREIGAWDPFNVTEDADLGIRLARNGYHCGTLRLETLEEAPPVLSVWFKQRTRWIKGWLQTLLVHTRHPLKLGRDLGLVKFVYFHLVITAIVVSVLIHPVFIVSTVYFAIMLAGDARMSLAGAGLLGIDVFNLVGGYTTYFAICWLALEANQKTRLRASVIWLPVYWLLISLAGWRAIWQLFTNPFLWEKTQHGFADENSADLDNQE